MAKKRNRKQKPGSQPTQTLEELLRTGECALYGPVCWSIANRSTEKTPLNPSKALSNAVERMAVRPPDLRQLTPHLRFAPIEPSNVAT